MATHMVGGSGFESPYGDGQVVYARCRVLGITKLAVDGAPKIMLQPCDNRGELIGDKVLVQELDESGVSGAVLTAQQMKDGIRGKA